ncbi:hypothetical protein [Streptomyces tendae]|uniref:hypothetical protein n=1 Tax=Streptomyces tendae TaxID=1932 RepID=UPI00367F453B
MKFTPVSGYVAEYCNPDEYVVQRSCPVVGVDENGDALVINDRGKVVQAAGAYADKGWEVEIVAAPPVTAVPPMDAILRRHGADQHSTFRETVVALDYAGQPLVINEEGETVRARDLLFWRWEDGKPTTSGASLVGVVPADRPTD